MESNDFLITVIIVITCAIAGLVLKSKKYLKLFGANAKYTLISCVIVLFNLVQDFFMRKKDKTELLVNTGKTALITGGTRGIGLEVIRLLLECDIDVIIGCRNVQQGKVLLEKFRDEGITRGNIEVFELDTSVMESVKRFAREVKSKHDKIDYLLNNAGILFGPYTETPDGYESQFATNYLGHFLLTHLLLPELKKAGTEKSYSRIINVSSCAHVMGKINFGDINGRNQYVPVLGYAQSKLAQVLFSCYLNDLLKKENEKVQVHAVHPGLVNTEIFDNTYWKMFIPFMFSLFFKTPKQGAQSIVHACLSPNLEGEGGTYIQNCQVSSPSNKAKDTRLQEKLFNFTKQLLHMEKFSSLS